MRKSYHRRKQLAHNDYLKRKEHKAKKYAKYGHKYGTKSYNQHAAQIQKEESIKEFAAKLGIKLD